MTGSIAGALSPGHLKQLQAAGRAVSGKTRLAVSTWRLLVPVPGEGHIWRGPGGGGGFESESWKLFERPVGDILLCIYLPKRPTTDYRDEQRAELITQHTKQRPQHKEASGLNAMRQTRWPSLFSAATGRLTPYFRPPSFVKLC
jgi:hypothetical protein